MPDTRSITTAKFVALLSFLVLVSVTYFLRREVLALSRIHFSSDEARALHEVEELKASYPQEVERYKTSMAHYEQEMAHYKTMLELFRTDKEEYMRLRKGEYSPPDLPDLPEKPRSPELSEKLYELNAQFRARKNQYFATALCLNWVGGTAALGLAGGLIYLILFDPAPSRWHYVAVLLISFVFMIGLSFHSIVSAIIGLLQAPSVN